MHYIVTGQHKIKTASIYNYSTLDMHVLTLYHAEVS